MVTAGLPGPGVFLRLNRRLSELRNYRLRLAFIPGAGSEGALSPMPLSAAGANESPPPIPAVLRPMSRKLGFVRRFPRAGKSSLNSTRRPSH